MKSKRKGYLLTVFILILMMTGCGSAGSDAEGNLSSLEGDWLCAETPLDGDEYTGYLAMWIEEDGEFSMYDWSGNPGINGTMRTVSEHELELRCRRAEFDPPTTWEDMGYREKIGYELVSGQQLRLTYNGSTLVFTREGAADE